ncbi:penicillin-binding protein 2 [Marinivivus vitaminiproducens]|uniref:penicillin-binding protein 2 n=1 Tax=Marinivivus vitaminiproducens TaxID=3035935 RepID=UPI00279ADF83|nr:penicillin-binding protein 2 [Geminicoccaceae bacterium SCSIO 64248]
MHHREAERQRAFSRRALLLGGLNGAAFAALGVRLYHLQVEQGPAYATLADRNRVDERLLMPERGGLFDRTGRVLARNRPVYRIRVVREQAGDLRPVLARLATLIELSPEHIARVIERAEARRAFVPVTVRDDLTWGEVSAVALSTPELPGVSLDAGTRRDYVAGASMAHIVGYVGPVAEAELTGDPLLSMPEMRIGKNGIERVYDMALRGAAGMARLEVNAFGREIRELARVESTSGRDVRLSVDAELQRVVYERLALERSASAVVLDAQRGDVLALASAPGFDPALFENGIRTADWKALTADTLAPLVNKAVTGQYPPGSTFKMVVAMAALEAGAIDPATRIRCTGRTWLGGHAFHCWRKEGHGSLSVVNALAQSCDCFFYEAARRVGIDRIAAMAGRCGLGAELGVDLPAERPGLVPTIAWKKRRLGQGWHQGETLVAGIGQGYVLATPLQLAVMAARIGTGRAVLPRLVREAAEEAEPLAIDPGILAVVREGMVAVVNGGGGTARRAALDIPDVRMAGKTGTSQVRRITTAQRAANLHKRKDKPWEERHHALFVGYAPALAPRFAVSVVVEHGESGSAAAAPIARELLEAAFRLVPPDPLVADGTPPTRAGSRES